MQVFASLSGLPLTIAQVVVLGLQGALLCAVAWFVTRGSE
jgi:hypothetical protein